MTNPHADALVTKIRSHDALVGIIGMGFVGLPLVFASVEKGYSVLGPDVGGEKITELGRRELLRSILEGAPGAVASSSLVGAGLAPALGEDQQGSWGARPARAFPPSAMGGERDGACEDAGDGAPAAQARECGAVSPCSARSARARLCVVPAVRRPGGAPCVSPPPWSPACSSESRGVD